METSRNIQETLLQLFLYNDYFAVAQNLSGNVFYKPIKRRATLVDVDKHLSGEITLAAYQLNEDKVRWCGFDVDCKDKDTARKYVSTILQALGEIPYNIEWSGQKGYHIFIFFSDFQPADKCKIYVDYILEKTKLPRVGENHVEAYPKQAKLTVANPYGSAIKVPLGRHPKTNNYSVFCTTEGWENEPIDPNNILIFEGGIDDLLGTLDVNLNTEDQIVKIITPYWKSGDRHNLALYLSAILAVNRWSLEDAKEIVHRICQMAQDHEVENRLQCVEDTFEKFHNDQPIKGISGLFDSLPASVTRILIELIVSKKTPESILALDAIRLKRSVQPFHKVRQSVEFIRNFMQENGRFIKSQIGEIYYYNAENKELLHFSSNDFTSYIHKHFGINDAESFGRQIIRALELTIWEETEITETYQLSRFDMETNRLYVHLGGRDVYVLDGKNIEIVPNVECGYIFENVYSNEPIEFNPTVDEEEIWQYTVDDLSFERSSDAPSSPEEQKELLKVWFLSLFFPELLPTKPILCLIGAPGSGKTTAIRRMLYCVEGSNTNVLELVKDKPDSLRVSVVNHRLLALDNLEEAKVYWLLDMLNQLSTGSQIEIRKLFKTNEVYLIRPKCFVAVTAVQLPFSQESFFSRILPINLQSISKPIPEFAIRRRFIENRNRILSSMLKILNSCVASIQESEEVEIETNLRLADFVLFAKRISSCIDSQKVAKGIRSLSFRQFNLLIEQSAFVQALEAWLVSNNGDRSDYLTVNQWFQQLEPVARSKKLAWRWKNAGQLGMHIATMAEALEKLYGMDVKEDWDLAKKHRVKKYSFSQL